LRELDSHSAGLIVFIYFYLFNKETITLERVKTGVPGFDGLIQEGIPRGFNVLLVGQPGAGKTIFGLQYLVNGAMQGENGIYVSLDSSNEMVKSQGRNFGWDVDGLEKEGKINFLKIRLDKPKIYLFDMLKEAIKNSNAKRLVFDSLADFEINIDQFIVPIDYNLQQAEAQEEARNKTALEGTGSIASPQVRAKVFYKGHSERRTSYFAINEFGNLGTTNLLITEEQIGEEQSSIDGISEYICDGVVRFSVERIAKEATRSITIKKMRNTDHTLDSMVFRITSKGISLSGDTIFQGSKVSGIT
jgi:KaiC/GvpD/RAD55 family RecA-like ATPase